MFIRLPSGRECHLSVRFDEAHLPPRSPTTAEGPLRRATIIRLHFPVDALEFEVRAFCHPKDRFVRKEGRFIAGRLLADRLREGVQSGEVTRDEQVTILRHVFEPETVRRDSA